MRKIFGAPAIASDCYGQDLAESRIELGNVIIWFNAI